MVTHRTYPTPLHYTVPEGSYASDPEGTARTVEFRRMVQGLNGAGLRTVMDVVYNHTAASGQDPHSVLDRIVPGYYQRLRDDGGVATSTCCAGTATEHTMMGKLVVDSVVTWATAYKVDGFRFDLMGHQPKANLLAVRKALDALTPAKDGVDGTSIILYGEGWNFGEAANDARFVQATQKNMAGTGIATFSDRARDAVRGGSPFDADPRVQGFASGLYTDPNSAPANGSPAEQRARLLHYQDLLKVGLTGDLADFTFTDRTGHRVKGSGVDYNGAPAGYAAAPGDALAYADAHDNETLYDALAYKLPPRTGPADRSRMQVLALATAALSQGPALSQAGSDLLRSKSLDRNSFDSGDWFNALHWNCADGNGFGRGLPPAADNKDKWPYARPLLTDPALRPGCATIRRLPRPAPHPRHRTGLRPVHHRRGAKVALLPPVREARDPRRPHHAPRQPRHHLQRHAPPAAPDRPDPRRRALRPAPPPGPRRRPHHRHRVLRPPLGHLHGPGPHGGGLPAGLSGAGQGQGPAVGEAGGAVPVTRGTHHRDGTDHRNSRRCVHAPRAHVQLHRCRTVDVTTHGGRLRPLPAPKPPAVVSRVPSP